MLQDIVWVTAAGDCHCLGQDFRQPPRWDAAQASIVGTTVFETICCGGRECAHDGGIEEQIPYVGMASSRCRGKYERGNCDDG